MSVDVVDRLLRPIDRAQRRWSWVAYSYAVVRKYRDDQGTNLAALLTYYAFLSIFPLVLVFSTLLAYALGSSSGLRESILHSALVEFPVIGEQLRTKGLSGHWSVLVISSLLSLWGAQGVASAVQNAFNAVWNVPYAQRPGFPTNLLRSLGLLVSMGAAVLATGLLSGIGSATSSIGLLVRTGAFLASTLINIGIFLVAFRLGTAQQVAFRDFVRAAFASAIVWQLLLVVGSLLVAHQIRHAQELYGIFGLVIGLVAWLHLQAQLTLLAIESDVVRVRRLWPRSVVQPPLTRGDRRAYRAYAQTTRRRPVGEQDVDVRFNDPEPLEGLPTDAQDGSQAT